METVLDHEPTEVELDELLGTGDERDTPEEYLEFLDSDSANADLFRLFWMRGDAATARSYLARIDDPLYRQSVSLPGCHDHSAHRRDPGESGDAQGRHVA